MDVGDEQIYRLRQYAPSEHVRIVVIQPGKKNPRYEVEFLGEDQVDRRESIPGNRLRGPWVTVVEYDALMANWQRLAAVELTEHEQSAVETVSVSALVGPGMTAEVGPTCNSPGSL